ncbi:TPA: hypothetical protein HA246_07225 [Candidatus Woesearchaeota archaeon]|nr:hypothetical protein [Candidatus Woesearchaeota archaeon]
MAELTTFLERIASRQSSFVLFGDRVYDILEANEHGEKYQDALDACGMTFGLVPSIRFADFERLDESIQATEIEEYSSKFIKDSIDSALKPSDEILREQNRIYALKFIMTELLPFLLSKRYKTDDLLAAALAENAAQTAEQAADTARNHNDEPVARARKEISDKLTADFGTGTFQDRQDVSAELRQKIIEREISQQRRDAMFADTLKLENMCILPQEIHSSVLGEITSHQAFYVLDGQAYRLMPANQQDSQATNQLIFRINGREYSPARSNRNSISEIARELLSRKKARWRIAALERSQDSFANIKDMLKAKQVTEHQMRELAKASEYDLGECGFVLREGTYYVFVRISKFATQDGRDPEKFWPYDSSRIAIRVGWANERPYTIYEACVIERRPDHPCLYERRREIGYCQVCNLNRKPESYRNTVLDMIRKLSDAVNVVMHPLSKESLETHPGLNYFGDHLDKILKQKPLTIEEAEKQGYVVVYVVEKAVDVRESKKTIVEKLLGR